MLIRRGQVKRPYEKLNRHQRRHSIVERPPSVCIFLRRPTDNALANVSKLVAGVFLPLQPLHWLACPGGMPRGIVRNAPPALRNCLALLGGCQTSHWRGSWVCL